MTREPINYVSFPVEGMRCASSLSSVTVVSNALRLRRFRAPRAVTPTSRVAGPLGVDAA